jgi:hypothetical protein
MTRTEELKVFRDHLVEMTKHSTHAQRGVVMSRARRARIEAVERALFDLIADLNEELERRGEAA